MSKQKFEAARELIKQGRYSQARTLLESIDHPKAAEWIAKLDTMAGQQRSSQSAQGSKASPSEARKKPASKSTSTSSKPATQSKRPDAAAQPKPASQTRHKTEAAPQPKSASQARRKTEAAPQPQKRSPLRLLLLVLLIVLIAGAAIILPPLLQDDAEEPAPTAVAIADDVTEEATVDSTEEPTPDTAETTQTDEEPASEDTASEATATDTPQTDAPETPPSATPAPPTSQPITGDFPSLVPEQTIDIAQSFAATQGIDSINAMTVQNGTSFSVPEAYYIDAIITVQDGFNTQETADALLDVVERVLNTRNVNFTLTLAVGTAEPSIYHWKGAEGIWDSGTAISEEQIQNALTQVNGMQTVRQVSLLPGGNLEYSIIIDLLVTNADQPTAEAVLRQVQQTVGTEQILLRLIMSDNLGQRREFQWSADTRTWTS